MNQPPWTGPSALQLLATKGAAQWLSLCHKARGKGQDQSHDKGRVEHQNQNVLIAVHLHHLLPILLRKPLERKLRGEFHTPLATFHAGDWECSKHGIQSSSCCCSSVQPTSNITMAIDMFIVLPCYRNLLKLCELIIVCKFWTQPCTIIFWWGSMLSFSQPQRNLTISKTI